MAGQQLNMNTQPMVAGPVQRPVPQRPAKGKDIVLENDKPSKAWVWLLVFGILGMVGGIACLVVALVLPPEELAVLEYPTIPSTTEEDKIYSDLTGLEVKTKAEKTQPTYCIQTPNGTDGARPQAGLDKAGMIFEAIAEAGITRMAAIYQGPTQAVIGPIRSLRLYYLQWDTPFDCTIVHAGGADDALAAVRSGGYKDMTENYTYMYRGTTGTRRWNNLFTTSTLLNQFATDYGYTTSTVHGFTRMTPTESTKARIDATVSEKLVITKPATLNTSEVKPTAKNIVIRFGAVQTYNVRYTYNTKTNTYDRTYENDHLNQILTCPDGDNGKVDPEKICQQTILSPSVVIAMVVEEKRAWDNYHEDITAIGSGEAYIFQNGIMIHGGWSKPTVNDQIKFNDANGKEIALAPGQTIVEAVPTYGAIEY